MKGKRGKGIAAFLLLLVVCFASSVFAACHKVGKTGKPLDPFDESGFSGGSRAENVAYDTDANMTVDGKFDESEWSTSVPLTCAFEGDVSYTVRTLYGEKGLYIAFSVKDKALYGLPMRGTWLNSCMELYMSAGAQDSLTGYSAIEYRHDVTGATEQYVDTRPGSSYSYTHNIPMFSRMQVHGEVNSGNTEGVDFEVFVRWDALCSDYMIDGEVNPDFVKPETVGIMPAYSQSEGGSQDDGRAQWCSGGGILNRPATFFRFNNTGYTKADAVGAVIGDSSFGRNKSSGWTMAGDTVSSPAKFAQAAYFKSVTESDYVATALIENKNAAGPRAGMIAAANLNTVYSFVWTGNGKGAFLKSNAYRENDVWAYDESVNLTVADNTKIRMTVAKSGNVLYAFVGDGTTEKFGGKLVAIKEIGDLGMTAPGFFTGDSEAVFTDFEVKQGTAAANEAIGGTVSRLIVNNHVGGSVSSDKTYFIRGEQGKFNVEANIGYKLTSLKVNGTDVMNTEAFTNGVLTVTFATETVTIEPAFERISAETTLYTVSGRVVMNKDLFVRDISVLIIGKNDKGYVYRVKPNTRVDYTAEEANGALREEAATCNRYGYSVRLPNGEYTVVIDWMNGVRRDTQNLTVNGAGMELSQVTIRVPYGDSAVGAPSSGTFASPSDSSIAVSANTDTNINRTYLKNAKGTRYVFKATVQLGDAWNNDAYPKAGIIFAGLPNNTYLWQIDASNQGANNYCSVINISDHWYFPYSGSYTQNSDKSTAELMAVRDGAKFYLFANGKLITVFTDEAIRATTATSVGFTSIANICSWTGWSFSTKESDIAAALAECCKTVTVQKTGEGSYEFESRYAIIGEDFAIRLNAADGYYLSDIQANEQNAFSLYDVETGVLTLKNVQSDITVKVTFKELKDTVTVTGSYGFASGLDEDSSVEIYVGVFAATVNTQNKTFTADVPVGAYTVTAICDKYVSVTQQVSVSEGQITGDMPSFDTVKVEGSGFTYKAADKSYTSKTKQAHVKLAGSNYTDAFALSANITYNKGYWNAAGFYVYSGGEEYEILVGIETDGKLTMHYNKFSPWSPTWGEAFATLSSLDCTQGIDITLIFQNGAYYVILANNLVYRFDENTVAFLQGGSAWKPLKDIVQGGKRLFDELFDTTAVKQLGIATRDTENAVFKNIRYTTDADKVAQMLAQWQTVTITGSFDYAEGLYGKGDTVTVKAGAYIGSVNMQNKTFSFDLPKNTNQTITLSSTRFDDVTLSVSVNTQAVNAGTATFRRIKLDDYQYVDKESNSQGWIVQYDIQRRFTGVQASDAFAMKARVEYDYTTNLASDRRAVGFFIDTPSEMSGGTTTHRYDYAIFLYVTNDRKITLQLARYKAWGGQHDAYCTIPLELTLDTNATGNGYDVGYDLGLIFQDGAYSIIIGTQTYSLTKDNVNNALGDDDKGKFDNMFDTASAKTFGFATHEKGTHSEGDWCGKLLDAKYTLDKNEFSSYRIA